jgi:GDPmannose 4,6-dehydratase
VQEFLEEAFSLVGLDWKRYVEIDPALFRPTEGDVLLGDSTKARERLRWRPKTTFKDLVRIMVQADLQAEGMSL